MNRGLTAVRVADPSGSSYRGVRWVFPIAGYKCTLLHNYLYLLRRFERVLGSLRCPLCATAQSRPPAYQESAGSLIIPGRLKRTRLMHAVYTAAAKLLGVLEELERPGQRPHPFSRELRVGIHVRRLSSYKWLNLDYHPIPDSIPSSPPYRLRLQYRAVT
jgi:hypothetical protein